MKAIEMNKDKLLGAGLILVAVFAAMGLMGYSNNLKHKAEAEKRAKEKVILYETLKSEMYYTQMQQKCTNSGYGSAIEIELGVVYCVKLVYGRDENFQDFVYKVRVRAD